MKTNNAHLNQDGPIEGGNNEHKEQQQQTADTEKKPTTGRNEQLLPQSRPGHFILILVSLTYLKVHITSTRSDKHYIELPYYKYVHSQTGEHWATRQHSKGQGSIPNRIITIITLPL